MLTKGSFTVGSPQVVGGTNRFLGTIVEIVSERGAYLAFEFDCRDKTTFIEDEKIPKLRWTKKPWKTK